MMKRIHLIRHAKSSWEHSNLSDQKRPLSRRGLKDCQIMADGLFALGFKFPNVYCSSATRAKLTIQSIAAHWQGREIEWQTTDDLYEFSSDQIWQWIQNLDDSFDTVTLVGHNPAFTDFINEACSVSNDVILENLPTCAYVEINAPVDAWREIDHRQAVLKKFIKPKMLKKGFTSL